MAQADEIMEQANEITEQMNEIVAQMNEITRAVPVRVLVVPWHRTIEGK